MTDDLIRARDQLCEAQRRSSRVSAERAAALIILGIELLTLWTAAVYLAVKAL